MWAGFNTAAVHVSIPDTDIENLSMAEPHADSGLAVKVWCLFAFNQILKHDEMS